MNITAAIGKRGTSAGLAVAIVATIGTGAATAVTRGGVAGVGHHSNPIVAERAYVGQLRPAALRVYNALSPAQHVLNQITLPHAGDAFAARDALARGEALKKVVAAKRALTKLKAPAGEVAHQHDMVAGVNGVIRTLKAFHALRTDNDGRHLMGRLNHLGDRLTSAGGSFDTAVDLAYKAAGRTSPTSFSMYRKTASTQTSWIFGADRSCSAAAFKLLDVHKYNNINSISDAEAYDRLWTHGLAIASKKLGAVPRPKGSAKLPHTLSSRLRVLKYNSKLFAKQLSGLQHRSYATVSAAGDQIQNLAPSLRELGKQLRAYGAEDCGELVGAWGGDKHFLTSKSGHHRNLNT